jgi:hypothetical protein
MKRAHKEDIRLADGKSLEDRNAVNSELGLHILNCALANFRFLVKNHIIINVL